MLQNGRNWVKKLIFRFILMPQDFGKWKNILRYISVISFISIAFAVLKLKTFRVFRIDSASIKGSLFKGFWVLLSQILFNFAEILTRGSLPIRQTQCLKKLSKIWILIQMGRTQNLQFWSSLGARLMLENQYYCLKSKFLEKRHAQEYQIT